MNRREVNCVPLPVVRSRWCRGFPQADAQARWNRFQLTISLVQQSITLTRCAQPTVGPAQISSCPTFRFDSARRLLRVPWCSQTPSATTNLRSRITRNTRFRFTGGFSFRRNHQVTRAISVWRFFLRMPRRSVRHIAGPLSSPVAAFGNTNSTGLMAGTSMAVYPCASISCAWE